MARVSKRGATPGSRPPFGPKINHRRAAEPASPRLTGFDCQPYVPWRPRPGGGSKRAVDRPDTADPNVQTVEPELLRPYLHLRVAVATVGLAGWAWAMVSDGGVPTLARLLSGSACLGALATAGWRSPQTVGLDALLLTLFLHGAGGPANPFTALYFVVIGAAAVVTRPPATFAVLGIGLAGYSSLVVPMFGEAAPSDSAYRMHLLGMLGAFWVVGPVLTVLVRRLVRALERRDAAIQAYEARVARHAQLSMVASVAAQAAHELGTPMGTIAVAARELERAVDRARRTGTSPDLEELEEDAAVIQEEAARCRQLLWALSERTGIPRGEGPTRIELPQLARALARRTAPDDGRVRFEGFDGRIHGFAAGIETALVNLIRNGLEASSEPVSVRCSVDPDAIHFWVRDHGPGLPAEIRDRVGEPFSSTKTANLGLGLFLVHAVADALGGSSSLEPSPNGGTCARFSVPRAEEPSSSKGAAA
jgi:two-component system, sensor histidine kinase RegB